MVTSRSEAARTTLVCVAALFDGFRSGADAVSVASNANTVPGKTVGSTRKISGHELRAMYGLSRRSDHVTTCVDASNSSSPLQVEIGSRPAGTVMRTTN